MLGRCSLGNLDESSTGSMRNFPRHWNVGSLCSGSGMEGPCLDAIAQAMKKVFGIDVEFEHAILSECNSKKQHFLQLVLGSGPGSPCLHPDVAQLHLGEAPCLNHMLAAERPAAKRRRVQQGGVPQHRCRVQSCDASVTGSACKSFSKFNSQKKWGNPLEFLAKQGGGGNHLSWITYLAWIVHLDKHRPLVAPTPPKQKARMFPTPPHFH